MRDFWALFLLLVTIVVLLYVVTAPRGAHAAETRDSDVTAHQIDDWIVAYSVERSSETYLFRDLVRDARRVIACESREDLDVINMRKFGARGEVGPGQFMPGPGSIFWKASAALAGYDYFDVEANVAATVELISLGYGPGNWSCW